MEPLTGIITGPEGPQHVQPKVMDVLVFLAAHAGELVERDTLLDQVWRRVTSEEVLTRCISELRRALGDERGSPRYIQTVPKRGYRLLEPAVPREATAASPATAAAAASVNGQESDPASNPPALGSAAASVAVLPFDNHSADPAFQFLGDAFAAELHSTLARVDRLRVASRRSSFTFKNSDVDIREIGRRLNVDFVISGSLQLSGTQLRVVAELDDAKDGSQVWAHTYDRKSEDLLAVEREIAEAIVAAFTTQQLRAEIDRARHTSTANLDAWGLVQKARACVLEYTPAGLAAAIDPLERAIEIDPDYPAAHATLASLLVERLVNGLSADPERDEAAALESASRAMALAPQDPFILKMVSLVWDYAGDHRRSLSCLRQAVTYAPFDFGAWGYMGWPLTATGKPEDLADLRRILDRLLTMEPQHPGVAFWLYHKSVTDTCEGRYDDALESAQGAVDLRPSLSLAWMQYANVLGHLGQAERARAALEQCKKINAAMTPKHLEALFKRMSIDKGVLDRRLGGLRKVGALRR
ncbi:MAG TPA: winged helix-turn-helix domain-containing protein [Gammaproteobacteria bacterium]